MEDISISRKQDGVVEEGKQMPKQNFSGQSPRSHKATSVSKVDNTLNKSDPAGLAEPLNSILEVQHNHSHMGGSQKSDRS